jgi:hypothetical protein
MGQIKDSDQAKEGQTSDFPENSVSEQPIRFANSTLGSYRHICAFFNSPDEEYQVLLPFIREGFERGEKAFHIVDPKLRAEHLKRLKSVGIEIVEAEKNGQFELLALIEEVLNGGHRQGFALTRLVAHMEWALEDRPGVNDLVEYETRLNYILPRYPDPVI